MFIIKNEKLVGSCLDCPHAKETRLSFGDNITGTVISIKCYQVDKTIATYEEEITFTDDFNIEIPGFCPLNNNDEIPIINIDYYYNELDKLSQLKQTQVSLIEQLNILRPFANKLGLYDAADYINK